MKAQPENPALTEIIRAEIAARGPVSFARFMEQALYHPEHGYYSSGRASIGRKGDYFTNVSVGPLFGELWAAQFAEIWRKLGKIDHFTIVEQGAHDGAFARDVLAALREKSPECFSAIRYSVVEPFPVWQERQSKTLDEFSSRVQWRRSLEELEPFAGVHFSNELLDAMPMRLGVGGGRRAVGAGKRRRQRAALQEKLVAFNGERFVFIEGPEKLEAKPAVFDWIDTLAVKLKRGFVIAVDYGFPRAEFREVVQARAQHRLLDSPFEQIGEADITMHVNWTDIADRAEANGLRIAGFTDQHHFLTGIISELMHDELSKEDVDPATKRALQTLLHPEMLGRAFEVLALGKDVDSVEPLAGLKFARDPRRALGI